MDKIIVEGHKVTRRTGTPNNYVDRVKVFSCIKDARRAKELLEKKIELKENRKIESTNRINK